MCIGRKGEGLERIVVESGGIGIPCRFFSYIFPKGSRLGSKVGKEVGLYMRKIKWWIKVELFLLAAVGCAFLVREIHRNETSENLLIREEDEGREAIEVSADGNYIKWVDFNITSDALGKAYELDRDSYRDEVHVDWIELLAYVGALQGGKFDKRSVAKLEETAEKLQSGETTMEELTRDMEYYDYYEEAYEAVLGGMVGEFSMEVPKENSEEKEWKDFYGLKAFSPIAKGFEYSHYDDFGSSRSYGYRRPHLGHDMMGQIGTPIWIKYRICASENDAQIIIV